MSEREHLLAAVCANPDEDTPRLVFADWCDENGEPDRARFIREQIALSRRAPDDPRLGRDSVAMRKRWDKHMNRWRYQLPSPVGVLWEEFHRGFVESARVSNPETFVEVGRRMMTYTPIADVNFGTCDNLGELARSDVLPRIRRLRFRHGSVGENEFSHVLGSPNCPRLTQLHVAFSGLGVVFAESLAACPHMGGLQELMVCGNPIGDVGLAALAASPHLTSLRQLNAHTIGITHVGVEALAASPTFGNLADLQLGEIELDAAAARALAASPYLRLTRLDLSRQTIGAEGMRALANAPNLAGLRSLSVTGWGDRPGGIGVVGARAIAESPYLTKLHYLGLVGGEIGDAGVALLAQSPNLAKLTDLNLGDNNLTDAAVELLINSPYLREEFEFTPCLEPNDGITADGFRAFRRRCHPARPERAEIPF